MRNSQLMKETLIVLNDNIKHHTCVVLLQHFFKHKPALFISNHRDIRTIKLFNLDQSH
jgi:hypothetical protein